MSAYGDPENSWRQRRRHCEFEARHIL